ncbi:hypothetical protein BH23GEM4_BH23GEM4_21110 [soil metagenome]
MRPYVVDSNLYIEATRNADAAAELRVFYAHSRARVHLHSVVAQELLAGATNPGLKRKTHAEFIKPFEIVGRIITPTHRAWKRAGEIMAELVRAGRLSPGGFGRGFVNDCVLAASARERGFVLVTRNRRDFELIRTVERAEVVAPWPLAQ